MTKKIKNMEYLILVLVFLFNSLIGNSYAKGEFKKNPNWGREFLEKTIKEVLEDEQTPFIEGILANIDSEVLENSDENVPIAFILPAPVGSCLGLGCGGICSYTEGDDQGGCILYVGICALCNCIPLQENPIPCSQPFPGPAPYLPVPKANPDYL